MVASAKRLRLNSVADSYVSRKSLDFLQFLSLKVTIAVKEQKVWYLNTKLPSVVLSKGQSSEGNDDISESQSMRLLQLCVKCVFRLADKNRHMGKYLLTASLGPEPGWIIHMSLSSTGRSEHEASVAAWSHERPQTRRRPLDDDECAGSEPGNEMSLSRAAEKSCVFLRGF